METREIELTHGKVALVDADDFERLRGFTWYASHGRGSSWYAARSVWDPTTRRYNRVYMHHMVFGRTCRIDHENHNTLDNRKTNLRPATNQQNAWNMVRKAKRAKIHSRFKGVYWNASRGYWNAQIYVGQKGRHLGVFANEIDAARTYNEAALHHFGEFAALNDLNMSGSSSVAV